MDFATIKISFNTCYYIRKLLLQCESELKALLSQSGIFFTSKEILEQLLESVYLEEALQNLLVELYQEENFINKVVEQLENLVRRHQAILQKADISQEDIDIKRKIFLLLGFKRIIITNQEIFDALSQISLFSKNYLGNTLTINSWQSTCPDNDWLKKIQIERSAKFTCFDEVQQLNLKQLQLIHEWVTAFGKRSSAVIRDFTKILNEERIGELPNGVLLLSINSYAAWVNML
ncbi:hypothetical protein [Gloeocapsopsis sp. IPPAS B-1203]|uniref:hypothetical protein n=1 Tax=Gloeocapsopsis sp. IPPAS B-1203 TaxID=2049454 RepID=UPI000C1A3313|nr:hypothetical protein [Gloeocapsopsis sp. IPPAS B-1203]PIG94695.1 hypothetical protein CSQ79_05315 [Gloeocapsopsis sp. IPPAS B-1203]